MEEKLTKKQQLNILLRKFGFDSNYNLRKTTIQLIESNYEKYKGSCIKNTYNGYDYFIVWIKNQGITGYIFKNNKALTCIYRDEINKKIIENKIKKFINYIDKRINKIDKKI